MSESLPPEPMDDSELPQGNSQLSEGILNALRQLQDSSMTVTAVAPTPTPPSSQDPPRPTSVQVPEPTPPPLSEWEQLRAQLREKPVDADGWQKLVDLAEESSDIEKIRETYEGMLETYPNTVRTAPTFSCENCRLTRMCSPPSKSPTFGISWTIHHRSARLTSFSGSFWKRRLRLLSIFSRCTSRTSGTTLRIGRRVAN